MKKIFISLILLTFLFNSCKEKGCTYPNSINYDPKAKVDDGSCIEIVYGCTDPSATNYNYLANTDNGTCIYTTSFTVYTQKTTFCNGGGIQVFIDNFYCGTINSYFTSEPNCGQSGTVYKDVTPGSHTFYAKCTDNSSVWNTTTYNVYGECFLLRLD